MYGFGAHHHLTGLAKLNEEAGEVIQVIGKFMMIEGQNQHWSGDLRKMLIEELADLQAAIQFVASHNFTKEELSEFAYRINNKGKKFQSWFDEGERHERTRLDA